MDDFNVERGLDIPMSNDSAGRIVAHVKSLLSGADTARFRTDDGRIVYLINKKTVDDYESPFEATVVAFDEEKPRRAPDGTTHSSSSTLIIKNYETSLETKFLAKEYEERLRKRGDELDEDDYEGVVKQDVPGTESHADEFIKILSGLTPDARLDQFDRTPAEQQQDKETAERIRSEIERLLHVAGVSVPNGVLESRQAELTRNGIHYTVGLGRHGEIFVYIHNPETDMTIPVSAKKNLISRASRGFLLDRDNRLSLITPTEYEIDGRILLQQTAEDQIRDWYPVNTDGWNRILATSKEKEELISDLAALTAYDVV